MYRLRDSAEKSLRKQESNETKSDQKKRRRERENEWGKQSDQRRLV
jgi:hypothetical protein